MFVSKLGSDKVMELDCSTYRFTCKNTIHTGLKWCWGLCYLHPPHDCLVFSGQEKTHNDLIDVRAVSYQVSEVVWRLQGDVEGTRIDQWGMLLFRGSVLVADGDNNRILVLDSSDVSFIKTIQLPGLGKIHCLGLCNTQIFMFHYVNGYKISFHDMKP